jgi:hypothetical protein
MPMPVLSWWVFSETNKNPVWSACPILGYSLFSGEVAGPVVAPGTDEAGRYFFGEVAERFKAAVLKTVDGQPSGGSNPSLSAIFIFFCFYHFTDIRDGIVFPRPYRTRIRV